MRIDLRVDAEQRQAYERAAARAKMPLATWIKAAADRSATLQSDLDELVGRS